MTVPRPDVDTIEQNLKRFSEETDWVFTVAREVVAYCRELEAWAPSVPCDWGDCDEPAVTFRLDMERGCGWLPVCEKCAKKADAR